MLTLIAVVAAYLTGSIPFGLLAARFAKGIDIRQAGSGNIGATNVGRVLGARWGAIVLLFDVVKGILPTACYPPIALDSSDPGRLHLQVACGLAAIVGHMFPCWLEFRGGKGVATALGVALVLAPFPTLAAVAVFGATFAVFRIVSLSSMLAAIGYLIAVLGTLPNPFSKQQWSLAAFAIAVPVMIIMRHRGNLIRLLRREEPQYRSGQSAEPNEQETSDKGHNEDGTTRTTDSSN